MKPRREIFVLHSSKGLVHVPRDPYPERDFVDSLADCWIPAEDVDLVSPTLEDEGPTTDALRIRDDFDTALAKVFEPS